jgi:hypothetical protein
MTNWEFIKQDYDYDKERLPKQVKRTPRDCADECLRIHDPGPPPA